MNIYDVYNNCVQFVNEFDSHMSQETSSNNYPEYIQTLEENQDLITDVSQQPDESVFRQNASDNQ